MNRWLLFKMNPSIDGSDTNVGFASVEMTKKLTEKIIQLHRQGELLSEDVGADVRISFDYGDLILLSGLSLFDQAREELDLSEEEWEQLDERLDALEDEVNDDDKLVELPIEVDITKNGENEVLVEDAQSTRLVINIDGYFWEVTDSAGEIIESDQFYPKDIEKYLGDD